MTYIATNFKEFTEGCVKHADARLKVVGNGIAFITRDEAAGEAVKDLGRLIKSGFSTQGFKCSENFEVTQKLIEWRRNEPQDSPWAKFGKENISRPTLSKLSPKIKEIVGGIGPSYQTLIKREDMLTRLIGKLYRYEKRAWALDHGADKKATWSDLAARHGNADNVSFNGGAGKTNDYVFSEDANDAVYDGCVNEHRLKAQAAAAYTSPILDEFEQSIGQFDALKHYQLSNTSIGVVIHDIYDRQQKLDALNRAITTGRGTYSVHHDAEQFVSPRTGKLTWRDNPSLTQFKTIIADLREYEAGLKALVAEAKIQIADKKSGLQKADIAHLKGEIILAQHTLDNILTLPAQQAMRNSYWTPQGRGMKFEDIKQLVMYSTPTKLSRAEFNQLLEAPARPATPVATQDTSTIADEFELVDGDEIAQATTKMKAEFPKAHNGQSLLQNIALYFRMTASINQDRLIQTNPNMSSKKHHEAKESVENTSAGRAQVLDLIVLHASVDEIAKLKLQPLIQLRNVFQNAIAVQENPALDATLRKKLTGIERLITQHQSQTHKEDAILAQGACGVGPA